jgi:signal transduction histidine kinase
MASIGKHDTERLEALARRVEELITDIGSVLHANTSTLFMAQQTIDVAICALGPNPFTAATPMVQEVDEAMGGPARATARAVDRLVAVAMERPDAMDEQGLAELRGYLGILSDPIGHIPIEESRTSTLRTIACRIQVMLEHLPSGRLPREAVRQVRSAACEVERLAALAALLQTRSAILQMDYTIRSFREFVTSDMRRVEAPQELAVAALYETAHTQLVEYAWSSNVEIRLRNDAPGAMVRGVERELVRALANILHNAIKYSWHRDNAHRPWVNVHVHRKDRRVHVTVENWGVPISARELDEGMVFELGYRGQWSTDRGRLGTGIGLTDARDVADKHTGVLMITSRPARSWGPDDPEDDEYYRQPFLTAVTFGLPEAL